MRTYLSRLKSNSFNENQQNWGTTWKGFAEEIKRNARSAHNKPIWICIYVSLTLKNCWVLPQEHLETFSWIHDKNSSWYKVKGYCMRMCSAYVSVLAVRKPSRAGKRHRTDKLHSLKPIHVWKNLAAHIAKSTRLNVKRPRMMWARMI